MNFLSLSPAVAGALLAATGATVVFLYWLKPPPRRVVVPSNLIWSRLLREKRRSTLLDRLRWWLSLIVALAIGLSLALALTRPEIESISGQLRRIVVVVDSRAARADSSWSPTLQVRHRRPSRVSGVKPWRSSMVSALPWGALHSFRLLRSTVPSSTSSPTASW